MNTRTRVLLVAGLVAALIAVGWFMRGQRLSSVLAQHQVRITAASDTIARLRADRIWLLADADSMASVAATQRDSAAALAVTARALAGQVRATADSLRQLGAATVPMPVYEDALSVIDVQEEALAAGAALQTALHEQIQAGGRLLNSTREELDVWQGRALLAEGVLLDPPRKKGWPVSAYAAVVVVTGASCSDALFSVGCIAGLATLVAKL